MDVVRRSGGLLRYLLNKRLYREMPGDVCNVSDGQGPLGKHISHLVVAQAQAQTALNIAEYSKFCWACSNSMFQVFQDNGRILLQDRLSTCVKFLHRSTKCKLHTNAFLTESRYDPGSSCIEKELQSRKMYMHVHMPFQSFDCVCHDGLSSNALNHQEV